MSFLVIGIIWVNHHGVFERVRAVDRPVLFVNLALLLFVLVIPFPTRLLAEHLTGDPADARTAGAIYSATMLAMGLSYGSLWLTITRTDGLLHAHLDRAPCRAAIVRFGLGNVVHLATVGLAVVSPVAPSSRTAPSPSATASTSCGRGTESGGGAGPPG